MLNFLEKIIREAGEICLQGLQENSSDKFELKGPKDLVTVVDRRVEEYLVGSIIETYPDHDIIGEETGEKLSGSRCCWLIDPIDGTTSYFHRQPYFSVSIALKIDEEYTVAGVFAPALNQLFLAEKGKGVTLNGEAISVSSCSRLGNAVLATGFACMRSGLEHNNMQYFNRLMPKIRDIRRCGSAALDMAYVAAGKYDGFWELNLNDFDIAAGILLVTEAGGRVCDFQGGAGYPESGIIAGNEIITGELVGQLSDDISLQ